MATIRAALLGMAFGVVAGCAAAPADAAPGRGAAPRCVAPATAALVVLRGSGDVDGVAGREKLALHADGTLRAGDLVGKAELTSASDYFQKKQAGLRSVVLDRKRGVRAVVVALPMDAEEDPDNRYQVFVPDGCALRRVLDLKMEGYGVTELRFPGDGSARYVEDGWAACARADHPSRPVVREEIVLRGGRDGLAPRARRPTKLTQDCSMLAACPFVYRVDDRPGGRSVRVGEILRNLRGDGAYALQSLAVPAGPAATPRGVIHLRLAEEKPEVTSLDEIYLEVDGERIAPRECAVAPAPAFCAADRRMHLMRQGDVLDLTFDARGEATLFARGFYVPRP